MNLFEHQSPPQDNLPEVEQLAWLRLIRTENVGPVTFYKLLERFDSANEALAALPDLSRRGGRVKPLTPPLEESVLREKEALMALGGYFVFAGEKNYPLGLSVCADAPPVLSVIGHAPMMNASCLGMVGARNASLAGQKFAGKLAKELGQSGQVIVSGLARGIDTAAHEGAIETGTIAVVAGGIDVVYPRENKTLYERIQNEGLVVAESPLGVQPIARHFPKRNRIVSGISAGVVVVEATLRSGSLITARLAGEQGRDVYAVPGHPMDPRAAGPNKLLQDGATLVQNAQDILQNLARFSGGSASQKNMFAEDLPPSQGLSDSAEMAEFDNMPEKYAQDLRGDILATLSQTPIALDDLIRVSGGNAGAVQGVLLELELAGRVQRLPGGRLCRVDA